MTVHKQGFRQLDFGLFAAVLLICCGGLLSIKSAVHNDPHGMDFFRKQIIGIVLGSSIILFLATREYETLLRRFARYIYPLNILLLAAVLMHIGHASHGAQRWIALGPFQLQPSEFAKIILIGTLSLYLAENIETIREWRTVLRSFGHILIPMLLIAKQPDLGTALVILAIWFGTLAIAGANPKHLLAFFGTGVVLFACLWHFNPKVGGNPILKDYQKNRLEVFLNPDADPRDSGYHLRQSEIAIGNGRISGEGYLHGAQSNGRFIPEQHTDFIFTIVGEEGGFVACVALLALYLFVLERGVMILADCKDTLGRLLAAGVLSMLTFHTVVNAGMTMGIMPVVGVPLPFFSYGLSSLIVNMSAVGILLSVAAQKHRVMF
ncbi:rod shape-determining protein RodA [Capsulimonas corticalis]|uniref:Rod shape-determining protein RodA n=1 Tax=Capsulimonas corticalis TaxID=2219043 RepID=A0A402CXX3_9BACT|nr:rod shape-determining protein RodA [Capsulimonas corticalis]BDI32135.1 rod shape-determining protein RodA [Capsulimonas corticalis]